LDSQLPRARGAECIVDADYLDQFPVVPGCARAEGLVAPHTVTRATTEAVVAFNARMVAPMTASDGPRGHSTRGRFRRSSDALRFLL
jgi:hypothetical protein